MDAKKLILEAKNEVAEEDAKEIKAALKVLYRKRVIARKVLTNIDREIELKEAEIQEYK